MTAYLSITMFVLLYCLCW